MTIPDDMLTHLAAATEEVFTTMICKPLVRLPGAGALAARQGPGVVATVAFAGHRRGAVAIHATLDGARSMAGALLGLPAEQVNGEVPDAIGEIANMVAGTFRNKLAAVEPASAIAVPTVTIGSDFATSYLSAVRRTHCPFDMEGQPLSVELILTGEEPGPPAAR